MFNYFEKFNNDEGQIHCVLYLIFINDVLNDYNNAFFYYNKGRAFLKKIFDYSQETRVLLVRILVNRTLFDWYNFYYIKSVIKYLQKNKQKLKITDDQYNFWMFVLYNNYSNHSVVYIRKNKKNISREFIVNAYNFSKKAKEFQIKIANEDTISVLTPIILELSYYYGVFNNRRSYYDEIGKFLFKLQDSKQSDSFNDTKEEIEVSLRELYLIDILDNEELLPKRKVELMQEMFDIMFITFAKSRMTQDEMNFRKYIINYIQIASKVISKEDIIKNISIILRNLHPFTFGHSIEVSAISLVMTEIIIDYNPNYFIGLFDYKTIKDVITNKANILNFVKYCGLSHDFGKIGIIAIISKSNRLTDYEFDSIKQHSMMGYEILAASEETKNFAYIALCHHKMNGLIGGYSPSVFEECYEFSSVINIINLADTVSAATDVYGRTYNGRKYLSDVQGEINRASDRYDPILLEIFNQDCCIEKIKHIITDSRDDLLYRIFSNKEVVI